jgi:hypothetical protein
LGTGAAHTQRYAAELAECVFEHAHLADAPLLSEAITAGLPGSGALIQTADQSRYYASTELKWTTASGWDPSGNISEIDMRSPAGFRCAAPEGAVFPNPNAVANQFVPTTTKLEGETMDNPSSDWPSAHDTCFDRGGHLPRSVEYAELVSQGMPNGSNNALWSSDQDGYDGCAAGAPCQFLAEINFWSGLDLRHNYAYTGAADGTASWAYKTDAGHPFRCVYYPIDPAYVPPTSPANCFAGCFEIKMTGATPATMWFDSQDRAAAGLGAAFADCQMHGGHLASERDYTEAVRHGLPNGTASSMTPPWLWTSDFAQTNVTVVRWTNSDPAFSDEYSTYMTWTGLATTFRYRCMWTNELR